MRENCNLTVLKHVLSVASVSESEYNLNTEAPFLADTVNYIKHKNTKWEIGVFERGEYHDVQFFDTETEACKAFL